MSRTSKAEGHVVASCVWIARRRVVPCTPERFAHTGGYSAVVAIWAKIPVRRVGGQDARHRVPPLVIDRPVRRSGENGQRK